MMAMPLATKDELRLDEDGEIRLSWKGYPIVQLRRPLVGEMVDLLALWTRLRGEVFDLSVVNAETNRHPYIEGKGDLDQQQIGAQWLAAVIERLSDDVVDSRALPSWSSTGSAVFSACTRHWFEVPLAFGGSPTGSGPSEPAPDSTPPTFPSPTSPTAPQILRQVTLGQPVGG